MKRILVTGGAGFIGSTVVDKLVEAGYEARILDIRRSPHHRPEQVETVVGDILKPADVRRAVAGCDAVIHMAAAADVNEVAKDPAVAEALNARGTLNVLEAARAEGVQRIVYASTIWVYSDVDEACVDEDTPVAPPAHIYSATKLAGELYCQSYARQYGLEYTLLRFGIPYGPRARPAAVVPTFVRKALAGEPLTVAGGGAQRRRFVYVEDLADGVVRALCPAAANRTYNLVGDEEVTVLDIASTVQSLVGDVEIAHVEGRATDFRGAEVDGTRARRELGWRAETPFREGVRRYIAWHREQEAAAAARPRLPHMPHLAAFVRATRMAIALPMAALVGVLAAVLTQVGSPDDATDRASFVAGAMLLVLPLAAVAGLDWARERRHALAGVCALAAVAAIAALVVPPLGHIAALAEDHRRAAILVFTAIAVAAWGVGRRPGRSREPASDSAA